MSENTQKRLAGKPSLAMIVPGLREPEFSAALEKYPAILKFLQRSTPSPSPVITFEQAVLNCFGFSPVESTELPAGVCGQPGKPGETRGSVTRVDPVFVKAEPDHASIHSAAALNLSDPEAQQLVNSLNAHFAEDGYLFQADGAWCWYLNGIDGASLFTESLSRVSDRNVVGFLDAQSQPVEWRQLQTEIQMVLHEHPVNLERESRGLHAINSVWCWGGHPLPERVSSPLLKVTASDSFTSGLAALADYPVAPLDEKLPPDLNTSSLVCIRTLEELLLSQKLEQFGHWDTDDAAALEPSTMAATGNFGGNEALGMLDKLLAQAMHQLLRGKLSQVDLVPCDGELLRLKRMDLLRFWRKRR